MTISELRDYFELLCVYYQDNPEDITPLNDIGEYKIKEARVESERLMRFLSDDN